MAKHTANAVEGQENGRNPSDTAAEGSSATASTENATPADTDARGADADAAADADTSFAFEGAEASDADGTDDEAAATADLEAEIARLREEVLRQRAETENVRRRGEKDRDDAAAYAVTKFARDMLSVADNLERALGVVPAAVPDDMKALVDGMELTQRELLNTLVQHKIERVNPEAGEKFDPNFHQAMFEMESADHPPGSVVQVVAAGYRIKERLLRPAMVGVAKGAVVKVDTQA